MRAYKYRLYPNRTQQCKLWEDANAMNRLYNYFLAQRADAYEKDETSIGRKHQQAELTEIKKDSNLKEIHSQVLQQVTLRLDNTFRAFFKNHEDGQGFPKFRSCKKFFGICYPQKGYSIKESCLHTKVYGNIKFNKHRDYNGNIKQIMITCDGKNRWFLCITTDFEEKTENKGKQIGIDVGITNIVATSDKKIIKNKNHGKYFDKQINKLKSRRDKKCKKGSRKHGTLSKTIRKLYDVKKNKTNDFLHKVSIGLSRQYDTIFCEDLSLKKMSESNISGLNRELRGSCLGKFISYLQYKTNVLLKVNPYNTSKTCNKCGNIVKMPLNKRTYRCQCGYTEDRDVNAAKNILCLGQAILEKECTELRIQEALSFR